MIDLHTDANRAMAPAQVGIRKTGILVRAKTTDGHWDAVDIAELDRESLLAWLAEKALQNPDYPTQVVLAILGHDRD